jgi:hypothetical protein
MKCPAVIALFLASALIASGAEPGSDGKKIQDGRLATATLLATARTSGKGGQPPDGMRFLFLVARKPDVTGNFTIKETRDFKVADESYQEKTQAELGKRFEPETIFDSAEGFFAKQPGIRNLAPDDIKGAYVLAMTIGGANLSPGAKLEITINIGFDKEVEAFTFRAAVPPGRGDSPKT